eukprot:1588811-Prymnesium_polylepis.2
MLADAVENQLDVIRPHSLRFTGRSRLVSLVEKKLSAKARAAFVREAALVLWDRMGGEIDRACQLVDDLLERSREFQLHLTRSRCGEHHGRRPPVSA